MPNQSSTTTNSAPSWALPYWGSYLQGAQRLSQQPYQQYNGQRVADFSPEQYEGMGMIADRARGGSALMDNASNSLQAMFGSGGPSNFMGFAGAPSESSKPLRANKYLASSGADLEDLIRRSGADTTRDYATGTAAQTDARAARAGAFGGSAYEEVNRANAASLADRLAGSSSGMRYQDLSARRGLEEAQLQREMQAGIAEGQQKAQVRSAALAAAASGNASANSARLGALQLAQQFSKQPYEDASQLMQVGGLRNLYSQRLLDTNYGDWQGARKHPYDMTDYMGGAISRATGGQGTQTQQQSTQSNPWANALGGTLALSSLYNMYR